VDFFLRFSFAYLEFRMLESDSRLPAAVLAILATGLYTRSFANAQTRPDPSVPNRVPVDSPVVSSSINPKQGLPTVQEEEDEGKTNTTNPDATVNTRIHAPFGVIRLVASIESILANSSWKRRSGMLAILLVVIGRVISDNMAYSRFASLVESLVADGDPKRGFVRSVGSQKPVRTLLIDFFLTQIASVVFGHAKNYFASSLSSNVRQSLIDSLMRQLVLSPHNLCHPEELVDSSRLDALMGDINQLSVAGIQLAVDRTSLLASVLIDGFVLRRLTGRTIVPLAVIVYLHVCAKFSFTQKRKSIFSKRVAERESALRKYLARIHRHRDSIALAGGSEAETHAVMKLVNHAENAECSKDIYETLSGLSTGLVSQAGGASIGLTLVASSAQLSIQSMIRSFKLVIQLSKSYWAFADDVMSHRDGSWDKLRTVASRLRASLVELPRQLPSLEIHPFRSRKANLGMNDVSAMSPDGVVLFQSMSFEIAPGGAVLVHGPKGCGKSALLRVIGATWPVVMGEVSRPKQGVICVLAKPYLLSNASFKEQIVYPHSVERDGVDIARLSAVVQLMRLSHLVEESAENAGTVLSDVDMQKMMIARALYHRPKYLLLDECFGKLDPGHIADLVDFLRAEENCGIVIACTSPVAQTLKGGIRKTFDFEIVLSSGKQPPRHELIVHRAG
jgi:ABC-type uncharacterized transport system fused permease/ATPase subunit